MTTPEKPSGFFASDSQARSEDCDIIRTDSNGTQAVTDLVTIEEPLEIRLAGSGFDEFTLAITMRTPGNDHELATGFLFGEGIIQSRNDCVQIEHCRPPSPDRGLHNVIRVQLNNTVNINPAELERHFYTSSSCGVCGKTSIEAVMRKTTADVSSNFQLSPALLKKLPALFSAAQNEFAKTGGIHASGLIDAGGNVIRIREDVGRHNAMDKLIGSLLLEEELPLHHYGLLLSGRASFELIQKAAIAGIGLVAAIGSPSSLAIDLAQEKGITLAGFLRDDSYNVYTHPDRLTT